MVVYAQTFRYLADPTLGMISRTHKTVTAGKIVTTVLYLLHTTTVCMHVSRLADCGFISSIYASPSNRWGRRRHCVFGLSICVYMHASMLASVGARAKAFFDLFAVDF